ncbi:hypothetical protein BZG01_21040 [Labilibaculum manganireducens]|uniref:Deacetylase PdaC domain-containing protein n=1 Tax=Labilibaculum manganireducens TaxID=1940525 RepID=A0A2N3HQT1_9BACT|nr:hypothetical protein [Labilibaculum manganireducens]PKQ60400.1 hypothetical protein BZG01_21040 [Labilibaculum manganireducens]
MRITVYLQLILICLFTNCASAQLPNIEKVEVFEFKDSIVTSDYNCSYLLPKILNKDKDKERKMSVAMAQSVYYTPLFGCCADYNNMINITLEELIEKERKCVNKRKENDGVYEVNSSYEMSFNKLGFVSWDFSIYAWHSNGVNPYRFPVCFDTKKADLFTTIDIFKDSLRLQLLSKIELKILEDVMADIEYQVNNYNAQTTIRGGVIECNRSHFPLVKIPDGYMSTSNGVDGIIFYIKGSFPTVYSKVEGDIFTIFMSLSDLKPYFKERFKKRIGLK